MRALSTLDFRQPDGRRLIACCGLGRLGRRWRGRGPRLVGRGRAGWRGRGLPHRGRGGDANRGLLSTLDGFFLFLRRDLDDHVVRRVHRGGELVHVGKAQFPVLADRPLDGGPQVPRRIRPDRVDVLRFLEAVLVHQLGQIVGLEGPAAGEHLPPDQAQRVLVGAAIEIVPPLSLLRRHVLRCSQQVARRGQGGLGGQRLGDAEIGQDHPAPLGIDQDVVRLDVAMDDATPVSVGEGIGGLAQVALDLVEARTGVVPERRPQAHPGDEGDAEKGEPALVIDLEYLDDVRVVELALGLGFPHEALDDLRIVGQQRQQDLDGHETVEGLLVGEEDDRHPSAAQLPKHLVLSDRGLGESIVDLAPLRGHGRRVGPATGCRGPALGAVMAAVGKWCGAVDADFHGLQSVPESGGDLPHDHGRNLVRPGGRWQTRRAEIPSRQKARQLPGLLSRIELAPDG